MVLAKKRRVDGISYHIKKVTKKPRRAKIWIWLVAVFLVINLIYFGRLGANFVVESANLLSLFKDGKYLVLFQNNSEIRSSGGFIGSFAVLEIKNYEIKNLNFNTNIYTLDREFAESYQVEAPVPVAKMLNGETWALRDANYEASFSKASEDILSFYQLESGDDIDGVIGLNAKVVVDLLKITGPIKLEKYDTEISADNFYQETQFKVEKEYYQNPENWAINEPKTFLKDLYPELLKRALEKKLALFRLLKQELAQKEIVFYFKDSIKQQVAGVNNWAGEIPSDTVLKNLFNTDSFVDYLYINSNSYSGNKSSTSIDEKIDYKIIDNSHFGSNNLKVNLKITRIHSGSYNWPDGKNTTWLRVYVPTKAQFEKALLNEKDISSNIEIGNNSGKTFFGLEQMLEPGEAEVLEFEYFLPKTSSYSLLVQKQPGKNNTTLTVNFEGEILYDGVLDMDKEIRGM